jgi:hypothetical protein
MSIKNSRLAPADPAQPRTGPVATGDHVIGLRYDGGTCRGITAAGLAPGTVHGLLPGPCGAISGTTATTVVAVTSRSMPGGHVDAGGTRLRLRALHVMGHGSARIARAAGADPRIIRAVVRGAARTISLELRDVITAVYDAWWDKRAPARTPSKRGAATTARKRAIAGNWCAAAALDDDLLDIPGYQPPWGWKPATGTGTAPDIYPPVLQQQKERHMAGDERFTWGFILEVLDVMERHGYRRRDYEHTGQAIGLIRDVARIYQGTQDAPPGSYVVVPSSQPTAAQPPGPPAVIVSAAEVKTLLAALDEAAEYKRDRAETCADCAGQSCTTCQWRLQAADAYDQLAGQMTQAAEASTARQRAPGHAAPASAGPDTAAGKETGQ